MLFPVSAATHLPIRSPLAIFEPLVLNMDNDVSISARFLRCKWKYGLEQRFVLSKRLCELTLSLDLIVGRDLLYKCCAVAGLLANGRSRLAVGCPNKPHVS